MLALNNHLSEQENETAHALSSVERLMDTERSRTQKMIDRSLFKTETDASHVLHSLQTRFSSDESFLHSQDIQSMIEVEVQKRTQMLFRQANYDQLTHLPNRTYFNSMLEELVVNAQQGGGEFTLLFLDLDGFKGVNDTFGHHVGDELLRNASARVVSAVREGDVVSRLGGDEFVVLLIGELTRQEIESICTRIIYEVCRPYWIEQKEVKISTSIGVARYPMDANSSSQLIEKSDKALYVSKGEGRNTYRFYEDLRCESLPGLTPVKCLEKDLVQGNIQICFEPNINWTTQEIAGVTMNACWQNGTAPPSYLEDWLKWLNQSSLAASTGAWLVDSGLYYLQQWLDSQHKVIVSIPMIPALCQSEAMVAFMDERLARYSVERQNIQLVFSVDMMEETLVYQQACALSEAGYSISLSGVGRSSLNIARLSGLSVQEIKLDGLWLKESLSVLNGHKWVGAMIKMAMALGAEVVATGEFSQNEQALLHSLGCSFGQLGPTRSATDSMMSVV